MFQQKARNIQVAPLCRERKRRDTIILQAMQRCVTRTCIQCNDKISVTLTGAYHGEVMKT